MNNCECIISDVLTDKSNYLRYVTVYRPPNCNLENSKLLMDIIYEYVENVKYFTIVGDLNFPDIDWENLTANCAISREFLSFCLRTGANQYVSFPTRMQNILDLVLCSEKSFIHSVNSYVPFSTSDHSAVLCTYAIHSTKSKDDVYKPCFRKADYNLIRYYRTHMPIITYYLKTTFG